jgi:hypothetical protein
MYDQMVGARQVGIIVDVQGVTHFTFLMWLSTVSVLIWLVVVSRPCGLRDGPACARLEARGFAMLSQFFS